MTVMRPPTSMVFHMNGRLAAQTFSRTGSKTFPCGLVNVTLGATPSPVGLVLVDVARHLAFLQKHAQVHLDGRTVVSLKHALRSVVAFKHALRTLDTRQPIDDTSCSQHKI